MILRAQITEAAQAMYRGQFVEGEFATQLAFVRGAPIEVRVAFDIAVERADFIRAADVIKYEWRLPK